MKIIFITDLDQMVNSCTRLPTDQDNTSMTKYVVKQQPEVYGSDVSKKKKKGQKEECKTKNQQ